MPAPPENPQTPDPMGDLFTLWSLFRVVVQCFAVPHEIFVRTPGTMGREYPGGIASVGGLLVVPWVVIAVAPPHYGAEYLVLHWWVLIGWTAWHRVARRWRPGHTHRNYIGDSLSRAVDPNRWRETAFGTVIGLSLFTVCDTLAWLHLAGTACSRVHLMLIDARDDRTVHRMRDAEWEGRHYADRMRNH